MLLFLLLIVLGGWMVWRKLSGKQKPLLALTVADFVQGSGDPLSGELSASNTAIRTRAIQPSTGKLRSFSMKPPFKIFLHLFEANGVFFATQTGWSQQANIPPGVGWRLFVARSNDGPITPAAWREASKGAELRVVTSF